MDLTDQLHDAFVHGDLAKLRTALADPGEFPDIYLPSEFCGGYLLEYAIYHSPLAFIHTLLDHGANPNYKSDDGFPSLIATLSSQRPDKYPLLTLLIASGANVNQRGINDWTPLHHAAVSDDIESVKLLLSSGADLHAKTRVDDYATPLEQAQIKGQTETVRFLERLGST